MYNVHVYLHVLAEKPVRGKWRPAFVDRSPFIVATYKPLFFSKYLFVVLGIPVIKHIGPIGVVYDLRSYHTLLELASYEEWNGRLFVVCPYEEV